MAAGVALVGERGPELLSLGAGAKVTPLTGADGVGLTNNFNINMIAEGIQDGMVFQEVLERMKPKLMQEMSEFVATQANTNSPVAKAFRG